MNPLHKNASIYTYLQVRPDITATCTVEVYVGEDMWLEEREMTLPYNYMEQDPLAFMCLVFMPWWPTSPHSLPAIEQCNEQRAA